MSAAGARRLANGELAVISACWLIGRLDPEDRRQSWLIGAAERILKRRPPAGPGLIPGARMAELGFALADFAAARADPPRLPSGERHWQPVYDAQGGLRQALDRCAEPLFERAYAVWAGRPAESGGALTPASDPSRGDKPTDAAAGPPQNRGPGRGVNPGRPQRIPGKSADDGAGRGEIPATDDLFAGVG